MRTTLFALSMLTAALAIVASAVARAIVLENKGGIAIIAVIQHSTSWLFIVSAILFVGYCIVSAIECLGDQLVNGIHQPVQEISRNQFDKKQTDWKEGPTGNVT